MRLTISIGDKRVIPATTIVAPASGEHIRPKAPDNEATIPKLGIDNPNCSA